MNMVIKALTALANMQRDRVFREEAQKKRVRKGSGFSEVLEGEKTKLKGGDGDDNVQTR